MSFYLKVVLLSNRMTSGIHTRSAAFATLQDFANPQFLFIGLDGILYCVVFILFFLAHDPALSLPRSFVEDVIDDVMWTI